MIPLGTLPLDGKRAKHEAVARCKCERCNGTGTIECYDCGGEGQHVTDLTKSLKGPKVRSIVDSIFTVARQRDDLIALMPHNQPLAGDRRRGRSHEPPPFLAAHVGLCQALLPREHKAGHLVRRRRPQTFPTPSPQGDGNNHNPTYAGYPPALQR